MMSHTMMVGEMVAIAEARIKGGNRTTAAKRTNKKA